jgi:hypothetical protein
MYMADTTTNFGFALLTGTEKIDGVGVINGLANSVDSALKQVSDTVTTNAAASVDASKITGVISAENLPSYVDDVLEYASKDGFPAEGESGKIYVAKDTNLTYRWSGTTYVEISPSLALGETEATAARGDQGKVAYEHAVAKGSEFASGLYKITTNAQGHVTGAVAVAKADITALGIPESDTVYTLPTADATTLGGIKIGDGVTISDGVASVDTTWLANQIETKVKAMFGTGSTWADINEHGFAYLK